MGRRFGCPAVSCRQCLDSELGVLHSNSHMVEQCSRRGPMTYGIVHGSMPHCTTTVWPMLARAMSGLLAATCYPHLFISEFVLVFRGAALPHHLVDN
jgi:hypothetical protein